MNDLPATEMPPDVTHLIRTDDNEAIPPDVAELGASDFSFDIVPFVPLFHGWLKRSKSGDDPSFGLSFQDDPIRHRPFLSDIAKRSASSSSCSTCKLTRHKLLGTCVIESNHDCVFTALNAATALATPHDQGVEDDIPITFALETKPKAADVRKHIHARRATQPVRTWAGLPRPWN